MAVARTINSSQHSDMWLNSNLMYGHDMAEADNLLRDRLLNTTVCGINSVTILFTIFTVYLQCSRWPDGHTKMHHSHISICVDTIPGRTWVTNAAHCTTLSVRTITNTETHLNNLHCTDRANNDTPPSLHHFCSPSTALMVWVSVARGSHWLKVHSMHLSTAARDSGKLLVTKELVTGKKQTATAEYADLTQTCKSIRLSLTTAKLKLFLTHNKQTTSHW